jgi:DNA repair protein RadA/Sms
VASRAQVLVIDSIQTMQTELSESSAGSAVQVRESAARLVRFAKATGTAVLLIGHVTKEGLIAGPRILEHMVDTVLYFESDPASRFRVVRAVKNRFGAANELGVFAMVEQGLREVRNPSAIFLSRHPQPVSGSVVTVVREGTRPILLEVQALVDLSHLNNPRRVSLGLEHNRLAMMLAVLHRHGGVALADHDVFINVVGGMRVTETGADLPMLLALFSSYRDRPAPDRMVCFGEVGLSGEIRPVHDGEQRLREAAGHGFSRALVPAANAPRKPVKGLEVVPLRHVSEALEKAI